MEQIRVNLLFTLMALLVTIGVCEAQERKVVGTWEGTLSTGVGNLRLVFHVNRTDTDDLSGRLDSPDQGAYGITIEEVVLDGDKITMSVPSIFGSYQGAFVDNERIEGHWLQGGAKLALDLNYSPEVVESSRPQEPKPPFPYEIKDVKFRNDQADIELAGTLTIPPGDGPFPALILVSGSGPQDRNEELLGHKPFWVLADHFSRHGIAVLRYDDRGTAKSQGSHATATSLDFSHDAEAAWEFLREQERIRKDLVGIAGHSEGGLIAPMVASRRSEVAFLVLLAGPGLPGEEILAKQARLIAEASGESSERIEKSLLLQRQAISVVKNQPDVEEAQKELNEVVGEYWNSLSAEEKEQPNGSRKALRASMRQLNGPWFRYFLTYDPGPTLEKVACPVLALNGEKDLQVPPEENLSAIERALKAGGNKNFKTMEMASLNHLFQTSETGNISEYGQLEETFSKEAMLVITEWIGSLQ